MICTEFAAKNHTATQSSFANPCLAGLGAGVAGFDSGFQPVANGSLTFPTFNITVKDTNPIWAYCRQKVPISHCAAGMVFSANAPAVGNTFDQFKANAIKSNGTSTLTGALGDDKDSLQSQVDSLKHTQLILEIVSGVAGAAFLACLGALIFTIMKSRQKRSQYIPTAQSARDFDASHHEEIFSAPAGRESMETLKGYSYGGASGEKGYSDPYDAPSSAVGGGYAAGGRQYRDHE